MEELGSHPEWVVFSDMWRDLISGKTSDPSWAWKKWTLLKINGDDDDDDDGESHVVQKDQERVSGYYFNMGFTE